MQEAAQYLVSCGLKGVGTDAISVDTLSGSGVPAHHVLLDGGLVIVENLCLKKLRGPDGRHVLRPAPEI